jgi:PTH2 family peptidyl-tRNA hydrolase
MVVKQSIIVRMDLGMSVGKLAAQVAHASISSFLIVKEKIPEIVDLWLKTGQKKVVLKVPDKTMLMDSYFKARRLNIPCELIKDMGLTELPPNTITTLGIGPYYEKDINKVTGILPLL